MLAQVKIKNGTYRNNPVTGIFEIVKEWKKGAKGGFITVINDGSLPIAKKSADVRVQVEKKNIEIIGELAGTYHAPNAEAKVDSQILVESDEQTIERITETFKYIETLTSAAQKNQITGLIISGPAGVGKSYGVEQTLNRINFQALVQNLGKEKFEIVTGTFLESACTKSFGSGASLVTFSSLTIAILPCSKKFS